MPIDFTTAGGQVRLLISDVDEANPVLDDGMITGYLARYGASIADPALPRAPINRAAADAMDTIATSEALIGKVLSTADGLKTDAAKLADSLRKHAAALRKQADQDASTSDGSEGAYFGVAEYRPRSTRHEAEEAQTWVW